MTQGSTRRYETRGGTPMRRTRIVFFVLIAFLAGVGGSSAVFDVWHTLTPTFWGGGMLGGSAFALLALGLIRRHRNTVIAGAVGACLVFGIARFALSVPAESSNLVRALNGNEVTISGMIVSDPEQRQNSQRFVLATQHVTEAGRTTQVEGKVQVRVPLYPVHAYGEVVSMRCTLETPEQFGTFDYPRYLFRYDIGSLCSSSRVVVDAYDQGNVVRAQLFALKRVFLGAVGRALPDPQAGFLSGLLVGSKDAIPKDLSEAFIVTGLAHIVALSGYNVSILAVAARKFLSALRLPRKGAFAATLALILAFVIMTGADATVVRAGIMGALLLVAREIGRPSQAVNLIVIAAVVMLLHNPKLLFFDVGFQLSFAATLGLILLAPKLELWMRVSALIARVRSPLLSVPIEKMAEALIATLAATVFTIPLFLVMFGRVSLIAPLANLLLLPLIPLTMLAGFIAGLGGFLGFAIATVVAFPAWVLLTFEIWLTHTLSVVPLASFQFPPLPAIIIPFYFAGLTALLVTPQIMMLMMRRAKVRGSSRGRAV